MTVSTWACRFGIALMAVLGGLVGGTVYYWAQHPPFPVYGYLIEGVLILLIIAGVFVVRRLKGAACDEFAVVKKRLATQIGFQVGFGLYAVVNLAPLLAPQAFRDFFAHLDGAREGFIMGQVAGMAPFVFGLLIGQIAAQWKYR